jgi:hypothetical protein
MIKFKIQSEDSSDHWRYLKPEGRNVLDLGCGRWCSREGSWDNLIHNEFSPIYIANNGAKKVIGVDASQNEIDYFNATETGAVDKFKFIHLSISSPEQLKSLILENDIDMIKSDIEGYETNFLSFTNEDLIRIKSFAVEYHSHDIKDAFINKFKDWGFVIVAHGELWVDGLGVLFAER